MIFTAAMVAIVTLIYLNKQGNRDIDRRNRLAEKQDGLIEMIQKQSKTEKKDTDDK